MNLIKEALILIGNLMTYSTTGYEKLDILLNTSSDVVRIASIIAVAVFMAFNPKLIRGKRIEDRLVRAECILLAVQSLILCSWRVVFVLPDKLIDAAYYIFPTVIEACYLITVVLWVIFVDYMLYRSPDHIRRRMKAAVLPAAIVIILDIVQTFAVYSMPAALMFRVVLRVILQIGKLVVEFGYVLTAVYLVKTYDKEHHEPSFFRLEAFIIPRRRGMAKTWPICL